jgi:hypothetical protein
MLNETNKNIINTKWLQIFTLIFCCHSILSCQANKVSIISTSNETTKQIILPNIYVINDSISIEKNTNKYWNHKNNLDVQKYEDLAKTKLDIENDKDFKGEVFAEFLILNKNGLITEIKIINGLNENIDKSVVNFIRRLSSSQILKGYKNNLKMLIKISFDIKERKKMNY